jgi:hypothetical protein
MEALLVRTLGSPFTRFSSVPLYCRSIHSISPLQSLFISTSQDETKSRRSVGQKSEEHRIRIWRAAWRNTRNLNSFGVGEYRLTYSSPMGLSVCTFRGLWSLERFRSKRSRWWILFLWETQPGPFLVTTPYTMNCTFDMLCS